MSVVKPVSPLDAAHFVVVSLRAEDEPEQPDIVICVTGCRIITWTPGTPGSCPSRAPSPRTGSWVGARWSRRAGPSASPGARAQYLARHGHGQSGNWGLRKITNDSENVKY